MDFNTIIDISSIIWDERDYNINAHHYFNLLSGVSDLLLKIENENSTILLRDELIVEMTNTFPANKIPNDFWAIVNQIYSFLGRNESNFISYPSETISDIVSIPNLIKEYYSNTVKKEVSYLISKIHSDNETENVYFTFEYLWKGTDKLKTEVDDESNVYETIISDNGNNLNNFFSKFVPIFEHNPKHDKAYRKTKEMWRQSDDRDGFLSQLSCYIGNNKKPQEILNDRYRKKIGGCYYGYDSDNDVYITFRISHINSNIYHGHDEYNIERIPNKVKKQFNIWKYKWN